MKIKNTYACALILMMAGALTVRAQVATIPIDYNGSHVYIKVQTGKSDSLRFVFDTGTTGASIDSAAAAKAGIGREYLMPVSMAGSGGAQSYLMAQGQHLKIGGAELNDINLVLIDFTSLSREGGIKLDGIIGYEVLNKYVTKIDFDHKQLLLYNDMKGVDTTGYTGIPFEFSKGINIPRFPITVTLANGERFTGKVMFDTGNAFSLIVSTPFSKFHDFDGKLGETALATGRGMNAYTQDKLAIIRSMSFNGFDFGKMAIRLTVNEGAAPKDGYLGILGIEVIKRFDVILDYAHKKIYLKPNSAFQGAFNAELPKGRIDQSAAASTFLEKNKSLTGVNVTPSGLQYKIITAGKGAKPLATDKVTIYYSLSLTDGKKIYSSFDSQSPWVHHIDKALPGMQEALTMMPLGSKWVLYIPSSLAFGPLGDEVVPPGATVVCEIELVKIEP